MLRRGDACQAFVRPHAYTRIEIAYRAHKNNQFPWWANMTYPREQSF